MALLLGDAGLFVEVLRWVSIIAVVLLILRAFAGDRGRVGASRPATAGRELLRVL